MCSDFSGKSEDNAAVKYDERKSDEKQDYGDEDPYLVGRLQLRWSVLIILT
jgi:hypothetical protein